jgi:hypothetical protein
MVATIFVRLRANSSIATARSQPSSAGPSRTRFLSPPDDGRGTFCAKDREVPERRRIHRVRSVAGADDVRAGRRYAFAFAASLALHSLLLFFFIPRVVIVISGLEAEEAVRESLSFLVSVETRATPAPTSAPTVPAQIATPQPQRPEQPAHPRAARSAPHRTELAKPVRSAPPQQPRIALLELGANDGLRGLPLDQTRDNLDKMITLLGGQHIPVLLLGLRLPPNYGERYTSGFMAMYQGLADKHHIALLPFLLENVALTPGLMQADGLHPNEQGQPLLLDNVWPRLVPLLRSAALAGEVHKAH